MTSIKEIIKYNAKADDEANERNRKVKAFKVYNYVTKDSYQIKEHLIEKMAENGKVNAPRDWELTYINVIPKLLRLIGVLYSTNTNYVRIEVLNKNGDVDEEETEKYNALIDKYHLNRRKKTINKWAVAFNTVPTIPVVRDGQLDIDIYSPHVCSVIQGATNYLKMRAFTVQLAGDDGEVVNKVYTPEVIALTDEKGNIIEQIDNPYDTIPVVVARLEDQGDFWGMGIEDACDLNTEVNVQMTSLSTHGLYQGGSILFGTDIEEDSIMYAGPNTALTASSGAGDTSPDLKYVTPDAKIQDLMGLIDFYIKQMYITHGISSTSYSTDNKELSGIAKYIDNQELYDLREDYIDAFKEYESKLYYMIKKVYNDAIEKNAIDGKPLNGDDVRITFDVKDSSLNEKDDIEVLREKLSLGISNICDAVRAEQGNPSLTTDECIELMRTNKDTLAKVTQNIIDADVNDANNTPKE